ncbi:hypothetical protein CRM22_009690 [Opisthorchis felineus]|uniref:POU domain protein n=1 Tax=Opisthorchis felineus TaxID=147828 RepID=A0A4S2L5L6_OPIFE|nr:hypothetical protein CRM22_009690 [Opisthorchis felineus]
MGRPSLTDVLIPFHSRKPCFKWHIAFVNSDGCKVYVPAQTSNVKALRSRNRKELMNELLRKMTRAFAEETPELAPLLKPGTEFFLKTRVIKPLQTMFRRTHTRLDPSTIPHVLRASKFNFPTNPGDLCQLEEFTEAFVQKRIELNLSQQMVARSLKQLYGINRSSTFISRIERLDIGLSHYLSVYPVLLQWLKDTEDPETCEAIIRTAVGGQSSNSSTLVHSIQRNQPTAPMSFTKQRFRKTLSIEMKKALEEAYVKHRYPPITVLDKLATRFGQDINTLRIWFYNRRANNPKR